MAVGNVWNVGWLNANAQRNYPLHDTASGQDTSGSFTLPNDLIVDLNFPVHMVTSGGSLLDLNNFCLRRLTVFTEGITVTLAYYDGTSYTDIASRTILSSQHTRDKTYYLEGLGAEGDPFFDSVGRITIGTFTTIQNYGGDFTFVLAGGRLLPTVMRPALQTLSGIRFASADGDVSSLLQGDVTIEAGSNISFDVSGNTCVINATADEDFLETCSCDTAPEGTPIQTINGVGPDDQGNLQLETDNCITLTPTTNGLLIDDTCASPCCGCEELDVIKTTIDTLANQLNGLEAYANRVHSVAENMQNTLAASTLNPSENC